MAKRSDNTTEAPTEAASDQGSGKLGYKILASIGATAGATVARKVLTKGWKSATGKEPPTNPEHLGVSAGEAATWAALSAAVVAVARVLARRRVAATWQRASGELPPGMNDAPK
jgi:Protein of unknown function (DUF4235)